MINPVIFIPCYNAGSTVKQTLDSVLHAIEKTNRPIPVYIYNDCSKDNSVEVINAYIKENNAIFLVNNETNIGERRTTNAAVRTLLSLKYDWMFIIHADDIANEDWLNVLIDNIEKVNGENFFTVWSSYDSFDHDTGKITPGDNTGEVHIRNRSNEEIKEYIVKVYSNWHISGAAFNLKLYQQLGGFENDMPQFGDTDFFVRGLLAGFNDIYISRTLNKYRIIHMSVSSVSFKTNRDIKETYFLIDKYKHILNKEDKIKMIARCCTILFKRTLKAAKQGDLKLVVSNSKEMIYSAKMYLSV
jgi:glycosyltransferase involved in cell wall biosynthesis